LSLPDIDTQEVKTIRVLLEEALQADNLAPLRDTSAQLLPEPNGRGPLLGILGHGFGRNINDEQFRNLVGIPADSNLLYPSGYVDF
jgi:hypothetical protein